MNSKSPPLAKGGRGGFFDAARISKWFQKPGKAFYQLWTAQANTYWKPVVGTIEIGIGIDTDTDTDTDTEKTNPNDEWIELFDLLPRISESRKYRIAEKIYNLMILQTYLTQLRQESLTEIRDTATRFFTKYHAVHHLHTIIAQYPAQADSECIAALQAVLTSPEFAHQRQSLFLYRMAAETLAGVLAAAPSRGQARQALDALETVLACTSGHAHRATAESVSLLPVTAQGPPLPQGLSDCPETDWRHFFSAIESQPLGSPELKGRSLVYALSGTQSRLVIKLAKPHHDPHTLQLEAHWMIALQSLANKWPLRFDVPTPIAVGNKHLVRLRALPPQAGEPTNFHAMRYALAFLAPADYYHYPNDDRRRVSNGQFLEILARNAWLMGKLAGCGIVHDAAIPLFHNRVQRHRRRDQGRYEWFRGGRLDRWLESCRHPNIGPSGLRDFEHFQSIGSSGRNLYRQIGAAFLSLLLIAGSFFRNRDATLMGMAPDGQPIDARHLFDPALLQAACRLIFKGFYLGFTGRPHRGAEPVDWNRLIQRMIAEMGVDRHMIEILRATDQNQMTQTEFQAFLAHRDIAGKQLSRIQKGAQDISFPSGPHLGDFNNRISLPEIIEASAAMAAVCMAGRHWRQFQ